MLKAMITPDANGMCEKVTYRPFTYSLVSELFNFKNQLLLLWFVDAHHL